MMRLLEGGDAVGDAQGEADVVPAVQQALTAEGIDAELETQPRIVGDGLSLQVDRQV